MSKWLEEDSRKRNRPDSSTLKNRCIARIRESRAGMCWKWHWGKTHFHSRQRKPPFWNSRMLSNLCNHSRCHSCRDRMLHRKADIFEGFRPGSNAMDSSGYMRNSRGSSVEHMSCMCCWMSLCRSCMKNNTFDIGWLGQNSNRSLDNWGHTLGSAGRNSLGRRDIRSN